MVRGAQHPLEFRDGQEPQIKARVWHKLSLETKVEGCPGGQWGHWDTAVLS